jgi:hypothetical protein
MTRRNVAFLVAIGLVLCSIRPALADWKDDLEQAINHRWIPTTRSKLGRVLEPGTVLVIQKGGLKADKPRAFMRPTVIDSGEISKTGGGFFVSGGRSLSPGDRVYLYDVRVKNDAIDLIIATVETYDVEERGSTTSTPYEAALHFVFDPQWLESAPPDDVIAQISPWLESEAETAAASVKTVQLGQTTDEVMKILGAPDKIIDLGSKVIYVYPDLKITFRDGKVADVE